MNHIKVAIIGSGPAGLTAALYSARADLVPVVFAGEKYGGQLMLTTEVENYPGFEGGIQGPDLMMKMIKQAEKFGAKLIYKSVTKVDFFKRPYKVYVYEEEYTCDSVIIATGASSKWLGLESEKRLIGRGVSSCATCDGALFRNKKVAVVGGGDTAMEEALYLTKFASEVIIVHRRDEFRASRIMQDRVLKNPKIKVYWNSQVVDLIGENKLSALKFINSKDNLTREEKFDGVFIAIGYEPLTSIFKDQIDMDGKGYIKLTDGKVMTNKEGIFVCGDVEDHIYRQAVVAAGAGCMAAMEAERYLSAIKN